MDKKTATNFVSRIEAHRAAEALIWKEMRERPDFERGEDAMLEEAIDNRKLASDRLDEANSTLDAFDWVDDGDGSFVRMTEQDQTNDPE